MVSRKGQTVCNNFPGGKVDGDETLEEAIWREVLEETGMNIDISRASILHVGIVLGARDPITQELLPGAKDFNVTTYFVDKFVVGPRLYVPDNDIVVAWQKPNTVFYDNSPFKDYNQDVSAALKAMFL